MRIVYFERDLRREESKAAATYVDPAPPHPAFSSPSPSWPRTASLPPKPPRQPVVGYPPVLQSSSSPDTHPDPPPRSSPPHTPPPPSRYPAFPYPASPY